jgi:hypothetical protein
VIYLGFIVAASAQPKPIRLRNEIIDTTSGTNRAAMAGLRHYIFCNLTARSNPLSVQN